MASDVAEKLTKILHHEAKLLVRVKGRLPLIQKLVKELNRQETMGQSLVRNDAVMQVMRDSLDMLVIDLCSLRVRMMRGTEEGIFWKLREHPRLFRRFTTDDCRNSGVIIVGEEKPGDRERYEQSERDWLVKQWNEIFDEVFPLVGTREVVRADLESLRSRFMSDTQPIKDDRDKVRAHRYEHFTDNSFFLPLKEIEAQFRIFEKYLNNLLLLVNRSSYSMGPLMMADTKETANDVADLITQGSINRAVHNFGLGTQGHGYQKYRDAYYKRLETPASDP
jgi:hypothetical protein